VNEAASFRVPVPEIDRLVRPPEWIEVESVARERTPPELIGVGIRLRSDGFHSRILDRRLRCWASDGVARRYTTGFGRPIDGRPALVARITSRSTRRRSSSVTSVTGRAPPSIPNERVPPCPALLSPTRADDEGVSPGTHREAFDQELYVSRRRTPPSPGRSRRARPPMSGDSPRGSELRRTCLP
jgi:hypothetical protein